MRLRHNQIQILKNPQTVSIKSIVSRNLNLVRLNRFSLRLYIYDGFMVMVTFWKENRNKGNQAGIWTRVFRIPGYCPRPLSCSSSFILHQNIRFILLALAYVYGNLNIAEYLTLYPTAFCLIFLKFCCRRALFRDSGTNFISY